MQIRRDFQYYHALHTLLTHSLLHLLRQVSLSSRYVPIAKRNEILLKYLKSKLSDRSLSHIKKDVRLMIQTTRHKQGNLERKLYQLNDKANHTKMIGAEKLYSLLVYLYGTEGLESQLFEEGNQAKSGILYLLEEQIEHCFDSNQGQVAPLSMLIQLERAPELIDSINHHSYFIAELKEWNEDTHQAHILLHPVTQH